MSLELLRVLTKSFNESVAYCPLVWMSCDKASDGRINISHKRAPRTVYYDNVSIFEKFFFSKNFLVNPSPNHIFSGTFFFLVNLKVKEKCLILNILLLTCVNFDTIFLLNKISIK